MMISKLAERETVSPSSSAGSDLLDDITLQAAQLQGVLSKFLRATSEPSPAVSGLPLQPSDMLGIARHIYRARRVRTRFLPDDLMGEPAWDILLDLYISEAEGKQLSVTAACVGACVPPTTGLRWLNVLERHGLLQRSHDAKDQRRIFLQLSSDGKTAMESFLNAFAAL